MNQRVCLVAALACLLACGSGSTQTGAEAAATDSAAISGDCANLVPPSSGPRYVEIAQMTAGGQCLNGTSDEGHRIVTGWLDAAGLSHWTLRNPDGTRVTQFTAQGVEKILPEDAGFQGAAAVASPQADWFFSWDHNGAPSGKGQYASAATGTDQQQHISVDDAGGTLVVFAARSSAGLYRLTAQRFDSHSRPRSAPVLLASGHVRPAWLVGAVNDSSKSLALFDGAAAGYPAGHGAAIWLDRFGAKLTPLFDTGPLPDLAAASQVDLVGLNGGSMVLQVDRRWVTGFVRQQAKLTGVPAFIAANGNMKLRQINGYTGYAFFPFAGQSLAACTQRVEIYSPSGAHCGGLDFPAASGPCVTGDIDIGACEGTVIQAQPAALESCASGACTCTHYYYPHILPDWAP